MSMLEIKLDGNPIDLVAVHSVPVGHTVTIQNKTNGRVSIWLGDTEPAADVKRSSGFILKIGEFLTIPANSTSKMFVTGVGDITVHHY